MTTFVAPALGLAALLAALFSVVRTLSLRRRSRERLYDDELLAGIAEPVETWHSSVAPGRPYLRRRRVVPWLLGVLTSAALFALTNLSPAFLAAGGLIVALLGVQVESRWAERRSLLLETQLADAIDLMVGALGAGAGATAGIEAAAREAKPPLEPLLAELLGRVQYGDDPRSVLRSIAARVPLETFLLFTTTLSVHVDVGGPLAPTLAVVGRTIRDRIEISRKIWSNSVQAYVSVLAVTVVTYFIAAIMWRTNPPQMEEFVGSPSAAWIVAGSMVLQALGLAWTSSVARMKF